MKIPSRTRAIPPNGRPSCVEPSVLHCWRLCSLSLRRRVARLIRFRAVRVSGSSPPPRRDRPRRTVSSAPIAQARGSDAATATFSMQLGLDDSGLAPDGRSLYGYGSAAPTAKSPPLPAEADVLASPPTVSRPSASPASPKCLGHPARTRAAAPTSSIVAITDGRLLIAQSTGYPGPDCGGCSTPTTSVPAGPYEVSRPRKIRVLRHLLDHGVLVARTGLGLYSVDLARRATKRLSARPATRNSMLLRPYVVYGTPRGRSTPPRVHAAAGLQCRYWRDRRRCHR